MMKSIVLTIYLLAFINKCYLFVDIKLRSFRRYFTYKKFINMRNKIVVVVKFYVICFFFSLLINIKRHIDKLVCDYTIDYL